MPTKATSESNLTTAAKIAKELDVKPSAVRQALKQLKIKPTALKAGCAYYDASVMEKIKAAIK